MQKSRNHDGRAGYVSPPIGLLPLKVEYVNMCTRCLEGVYAVPLPIVSMVASGVNTRDECFEE